MNVTDWNAIADAYSEIDDPEGRAVLAFVREKLTTLQPKRLLGYGGDDGKFAVLCAESLPLQKSLPMTQRLPRRLLVNAFGVASAKLAGSARAERFTDYVRNSANAKCLDATHSPLVISFSFPLFSDSAVVSK